MSQRFVGLGLQRQCGPNHRTEQPLGRIRMTLTWVEMFRWQLGSAPSAFASSFALSMSTTSFEVVEVESNDGARLASPRGTVSTKSCRRAMCKRSSSSSESFKMESILSRLSWQTASRSWVVSSAKAVLFGQGCEAVVSSLDTGTS